MKSKRLIKIIGSICLVAISVLVYSSLFGNPISYLKAKSEISSYIEKKYKNELEIEAINYSFKFNGYNATVSHKNNSSYKSYITYHNTGYLSDGYEFEVNSNIEEEVKSIIESLISQGTDLSRENIGVEPSIKVSSTKYKLHDNYSGVEPIDLNIWLHPPYSYTEEEFAKSAYEVVKVLQNTKYNFASVEIYSYKEDGNTSYRIKLTKDEIQKIQNNLKDKVYIQKSEKELEIKK